MPYHGYQVLQDQEQEGGRNVHILLRLAERSLESLYIEQGPELLVGGQMMQDVLKALATPSTLRWRGLVVGPFSTVVASCGIIARYRQREGIEASLRCLHEPVIHLSEIKEYVGGSHHACTYQGAYPNTCHTYS